MAIRARPQYLGGHACEGPPRHPMENARMSGSSYRPVILAGLALIAVSACRDATLFEPVLPEPTPEPGHVLCRVTVRTATVECDLPAVKDRASAGAAVSADRIMGGQDLYVKLSSDNVSYDGGTQIFQADVYIQNLTQHLLGTTDGSTVAGHGARIFFEAEPVVTSGAGSVSVHNPDGYDTFTGVGQPFFGYSQILMPNQISEHRTWQFDVPATVNSFVFTVFVSAPMVEEGSPLLDRLWAGEVDAAWELDGNWAGGAAPDSASAVMIPSDSLIAGPGRPVLAGDAAVRHLRVGTGSTLDLQGYTLSVWGNVDATGPIVGGMVHMGGANGLLNGTVPSLRVTSSVRLQRAVKTTGAVSISDGSLTVMHPLSISVP